MTVDEDRRPGTRVGALMPSADDVVVAATGCAAVTGHGTGNLTEDPATRAGKEDAL